MGSISEMWLGKKYTSLILHLPNVLKLILFVFFVMLQFDVLHNKSVQLHFDENQPVT